MLLQLTFKHIDKDISTPPYISTLVHWREKNDKGETDFTKKMDKISRTHTQIKVYTLSIYVAYGLYKLIVFSMAVMRFSVAFICNYVQ